MNLSVIAHGFTFNDGRRGSVLCGTQPKTGKHADSGGGAWRPEKQLCGSQDHFSDSATDRCDITSIPLRDKISRVLCRRRRVSMSVQN